MKKALNPEFFNRPSLEVAHDLLGKSIVKSSKSSVFRAIITDVEAYGGQKDKASHARFGKTPRNGPMFGPAGVWYVYFTYGMHWMLNIVTGKEGEPGAVLIRGIHNISGPGRVTKFLQIDGKLSGKKANKLSGLWIEDLGIKIPEQKIKKVPRVGIHYAGPLWAKRKWRLFIDLREPFFDG